MANPWGLREELAEGGPSETNSRDSLFGEQIIEDQEPELFASFYTERNPADQAVPHPFQPFSLEEFWIPSPLELPADPIEPIMTSFLNPAHQTSTSTKEYGLNKPTPFSSNRTKVKAFLQECLVYININKDIYTTDKLKIGFALSYMNEKCYIFAILYFYSTLFPLRLLNSLGPRTYGYTRSLILTHFFIYDSSFLLLTYDSYRLWLIL